MLKSLELFGFKSFADRTEFAFDAGVTCVVGPNGSGKSNVVDALKWILGDQSARSLRGKEMTDVIFNGSSGRKGSAFAEATLTFDNSQGLLPIEATQVQIGRRIWRNGEAEYLINRAPARLKDVRDLFAGTGAGSAAYSIIEQGRVDQILQANPTNRRLVFEEAAGISRFKSRRVEAERKLERVAQSLQRLTDIVDEVEGQLNATRSQAVKAARFRDLTVQLRQWWLGLAADDARRWTAEQTRLRQEQAELQQQLEELNAGQRELDGRESELDRGLSELDEHVRAVERRHAGAREAIAAAQTSFQLQTSRQEELVAETAHLIEQRQQFERRLSETITQRSEHEALAQSLQAELLVQREQVASADEQLQRCQAVLNECRSQLEGDRQRRLELVRTVSSQANAVLTLQSQLATVDAVLEQAQTDWQRCEEALRLQRLQLAHHREAIEAAEQELEQAAQSVRAVQASRQQAVEAQEQARQRAAERRERRSAALARRTLLEDLDLRQEGLSIGVRDILTRARTTTTPPWNSVVGSVVELLEVPLAEAAIIEVALGGRAQWIVLREYQPWLDYLSDPKVSLAGRVGFLAMPSQREGQSAVPVRDKKRLIHLPQPEASRPMLLGQPGVVARADQLVEGEPTVPGLAAAVLGDTWVVETLQHAVRLSTEAGRGCRFVTLQGELIDECGSLQLGSVRSEAAVLSRKTELRLIKKELADLDRSIDDAERDLAAALRAATHANEQLELALSEQDRHATHVASVRSAASAVEQEAQRLERDRQRLKDRYTAASEERTRFEQELQQAESLAQAADGELQVLETSLLDVENLLASVEQDVVVIEQRCTSDRLDVVKQEERLSAVLAQLERLNVEQEQRQAQAEAAQLQLEQAQGRRSELETQLEQSRVAAEEQQQVAIAIARELEVHLERRQELKLQRASLGEKQSQLRQQRRGVSDRVHAAELRLNELQQWLSTLDERLKEEYQLGSAEVIAEGHSAYELLLRERVEGRGDPTLEDAAAGGTTPSGTAASGPAGSRTGAAHGGLSKDPPPSYEEARPELEQRVQRLRKRLKLLGHVNTESLRDLEALETRFTTLSTHLQDLVEAKAMLEDIIRRANADCKKLFAQTFQTIRNNFRELFRKVFGGGEGDIVLEDPEDLLECGIEITARPPGKELRSLSLLSGGEKTMTAIALIMAIFQAKPSPFCILDEVDAALDEANVERFANIVREFRSSTQFIMITHHKRSMTVADLLYGVTMEESGVSKRMTVRFEDVTDDGRFREPDSANRAA